MIERAIEIKTAAGTADGYIYEQGTGWWPGVIYYTDIMGIRPANREIAKRIAANGYTVLMPNVFYRTAKPPVFSPEQSSSDEAKRQRFGELAAALPPEAMESDAGTYIDFLTEQESVGGEPFGVIGTCFTGAMAMRTAALRSEKNSRPGVLPWRLPLYRFAVEPAPPFAEDQSPAFLRPRHQRHMISAEAIAKLEKALAAWGGQY